MSVTNIIIKEDLNVIFKSGLDWQRFNNKTVLITGANGFLPAYMVETLLYLNDNIRSFNVKVIALVRNVERAKKRFNDYLDDKHLLFLNQDVSSNVDIKEDIHFVIHAASQASPKYYGTDPVGTLSANVLGTINLMQLALDKSIESFLYFSSGEVYGKVEEGKMPVSESDYGYVDPTEVRSCYAESKRMGENICVSYHHQYRVPAKIVRPFHTYGPKMMLDDGRVYADFVSDVLNNSNIIMKSDGKAIRTFCYLSDATIGFFTVLLNGVSGQAYNIANPNEEHSIITLAKKIVSIYDNIKVEEFPENNNNNYLKSVILRNAASIAKVNKLGWNPQINVEVGFKRTIDSYKQ